MGSGPACTSCEHPRHYHGTEPGHACIGPRPGDSSGARCGCPHFTTTIVRANPEQPLPVQPTYAALEWWGSDCIDCDGNTTFQSNVCDSCGGTNTKPLYAIKVVT